MCGLVVLCTAVGNVITTKLTKGGQSVLKFLGFGNPDEEVSMRYLNLCIGQQEVDLLDCRNEFQV